MEKREGKTKEKKNNGRFVYPSGMFDLFIWSVNGQYYVTLPSNAGIVRLRFLLFLFFFFFLFSFGSQTSNEHLQPLNSMNETRFSLLEWNGPAQEDRSNLSIMPFFLWNFPPTPAFLIGFSSFFIFFLS